MGGEVSVVKVSVVNETPYTWYFSTQDRGYTDIGPHRTISYEEALANRHYIRFRYENHSEIDLAYDSDTLKGDTSFILSETDNLSQIQMRCTPEGSTRYCPNYGKIKKEEEERRRLQEKTEEGKRRQREEDRRCRPR